LKKNKQANTYKIQSFLAVIAMWLTQDIILRFFFSKKIVEGKEFLKLVDGPLIIAPSHRSRWDGLVLTFAIGRRVTNRDCRFMVTTPEMKGIQGWFLKRLGCFSINQESPSLFSLRYAIELIFSKNQLVIFPEGKITEYSKNLKLKQGLFRLAKLARKRGEPIKIIPIGIAYDNKKPKFRDRFAICIEKPLDLDDFSKSSADEFNFYLKACLQNAEGKALKQVGRKLDDQLD
tara:strand:- start:736 stop:1431 length:696 start_codon:yes stop_codon:yes gene_type:complete